MKRTMLLMAAGSSVIAGLVSASLGATPVIDGTLDAAYGSPLAVQTQVTNTPYEANTSTPSGATIPLRQQIKTYSQLSAAYGYIDTTNNVLDLFFAGSLNLGADTTDTALGLAIQTNRSGVSSLANQATPVVAGSQPLNAITFDTGFNPNALFTFQYNGGIASDYYNLTTATHVAADLDASSGSTASKSQIGADSFNSGHTYGYDDPSGQLANGEGSGNPTTDGANVRTRTDPGAPTYSIVTNNTYDQIHIGSGSAATTGTASIPAAPADPGFTGAQYGTELQIALTDDPTNLEALYYTGGPIEASAFITNKSFQSITNQVIAPASATFNADPVNDPDYFGAGGGGDFANATAQYAGNQFFTIPAPPAVPEPASLGLLAAGALMLGRRRSAS